MRPSKKVDADSVGPAYEAMAAAPLPRRNVPWSAIPAPYAAFPSPAHQLQQMLVQEYHRVPVRKWPPAATLGFVLVTCGGFWTGLGLLVSKLV